ncbi:hypothetical protein DPMN_056462 [Dreissena polymorpha]|uniref:Transmembrane protein n=1 Tax=Dreissena polymorpha TaxID=45954 RepID=A0A9D4CRQ9_DREPO|nr:hypothetical protein DPMN_056462 [Dreissena polymorpha]
MFALEVQSLFVEHGVRNINEAGVVVFVVVVVTTNVVVVVVVGASADIFGKGVVVNSSAFVKVDESKILRIYSVSVLLSPI